MNLVCFLQLGPYMTSRLLQYGRTGYSLTLAMRVGFTNLFFLTQRQPIITAKKAIVTNERTEDAVLLLTWNPANTKLWKFNWKPQKLQGERIQLTLWRTQVDAGEEEHAPICRIHISLKIVQKKSFYFRNCGESLLGLQLRASVHTDCDA